MASLTTKPKDDGMDEAFEKKKNKAVKSMENLLNKYNYDETTKIYLEHLLKNVENTTDEEIFDKNLKDFTSTIREITNKKNPVTTSAAALVTKSNLFSNKKKPATKTPIEAIGAIKEQIRLMEKECEHLKKRIKKFHMDALKKSKAKNKKGAMLDLTRKKLLEKQLSQKEAQQKNLETQLFALENAIQNKQNRDKSDGKKKEGGRRKTRRRKTKRKKTKRKKTKTKKTKRKSKTRRRKTKRKTRRKTKKTKKR
jgi:hypothetical protein